MNKFFNMSHEEALNEICTDNGLRADTLNALHACRVNHPMGNEYQWRNAHALVSQAKFFSGITEAISWLAACADTERAYYKNGF